MQKSKFHETVVQNRRVARHAIDATPARWRAPDSLVDLRTEAGSSICNGREGRRRHAGRAAAAHSARRVVKYALAVLVFPQEHWHLALFAHPSHLHVAVVRGADGVVAGPRALVRAQRATFLGAPVPVQIKQPRQRPSRRQQPAARALGLLVEPV